MSNNREKDYQNVNGWEDRYNKLVGKVFQLFKSITMNSLHVSKLWKMTFLYHVDRDSVNSKAALLTCLIAIWVPRFRLESVLPVEGFEVDSLLVSWSSALQIYLIASFLHDVLVYFSYSFSLSHDYIMMYFGHFKLIYIFVCLKRDSFLPFSLKSILETHSAFSNVGDN